MHYIDKLTDKNYITISIYRVKEFDKIQSPCMIKKIFTKVGIDGSFIIVLKDIYKKSTANIVVKDEKFSLRSGTRQNCLLLPLIFNILLEVLAQVSRQGNEIGGIYIEKEEVYSQIM